MDMQSVACKVKGGGGGGGVASVKYKTPGKRSDDCFDQMNNEICLKVRPLPVVTNGLKNNS